MRLPGLWLSVGVALGGGVLGAPGVAILFDLRLLPVMVESNNEIDRDLRPQRSASLGKPVEKR